LSEILCDAFTDQVRWEMNSPRKISDILPSKAPFIATQLDTRRRVELRRRGVHYLVAIRRLLSLACEKHSSGLSWIKCYWKLTIPCITSFCELMLTF